MESGQPEWRARFKANRARGRRRVVIALATGALALLVVVGAVRGWAAFAAWRAERQKYAELNDRLLEAIGNDRGYTETILRTEDDAPSITYGELLDMCDKSVQQRTDLIVELRGLYPQISWDFRTQLIDQLNLENELVRSKRSVYYNLMNLNAQAKGYADYLACEPEYSYYFPSFWVGWNRTRQQLRSEAFETIDTAAQSAVDYKASYSKLCDSEAALIDLAKRHGFHLDPLFSTYKAKNFEFAKDSKEQALAVKAALRNS